LPIRRNDGILAAIVIAATASVITIEAMPNVRYRRDKKNRLKMVSDTIATRKGDSDTRASVYEICEENTKYTAIEGTPITKTGEKNIKVNVKAKGIITRKRRG
jgi:hypothetical protein